MENPSHHRVPPQALEAEMSVLGAICIENDAISRAMEIISQADFYRESHRKIFGAMLDLFNRREPCDFITLSEALKRTGDLDVCGGAAYLTTLVDYVPTSANIQYYANIVKEKALGRSVLTTATKLAAEVYDNGKDPLELVEKAQHDLFALTQASRQRSGVFTKNLIPDFLKSLQQRYEQKDSLTGITTGLDDLDKMTTGLQPGDLIIIAARPSMGKTVLGLNIAERAAKSGKTIAVFSMEMSKDQLMMRLAASLSGVNMHAMQSGSFVEVDWLKLQRAMATLHTLPLIIDDTPAMDPLTLRAKCRQLASLHQIDMIVIDYLQLMSSSSKSKENRQQEISDISRSLKALAKELNVPVVALSQLNRGLENRKDKRPMLSDLRESGAIEQDADLIMFVYRETVYCDKCKTGTCETPDHNKIAEVIIGKQRNGPIGSVHLVFNGSNARFDSAVRGGTYA